MINLDQLLSKLHSESEYINKIEIYDLLIEFILEKEEVNLNITKYLNELFIVQYDKLKYYLRDKDYLSSRILERSITDNEALILLKELISYEKRYLL